MTVSKTEESLQGEFIEFIKKNYSGTIAISNLSGMYLHVSLRSRARKLQTHGKQADVIVLEARGGYGGFIWELKKRHDEFLYANGSGFKPGSKNHIWAQVANLRYLEDKGYYTDIGTLSEAQAALSWYMTLPESFTTTTNTNLPKTRNLDKYKEGSQ
jgi:hypothetical protein